MSVGLWHKTSNNEPKPSCNPRPSPLHAHSNLPSFRIALMNFHYPFHTPINTLLQANVEVIGTALHSSHLTRSEFCPSIPIQILFGFEKDWNWQYWRQFPARLWAWSECMLSSIFDPVLIGWCEEREIWRETEMSQAKSRRRKAPGKL